jgi:DNA gyrase/topoisomerase IV subunit A
MRKAITYLDFIISCVKDKKLDDAGLVAAISKRLQITDEETNQILARNLRQLRHLEDEKLVEQIKNIEKEKASYEVRLKRPSAYIAKHLDELQAKIK